MLDFPFSLKISIDWLSSDKTLTSSDCKTGSTESAVWISLHTLQHKYHDEYTYNNLKSRVIVVHKVTKQGQAQSTDLRK